MRHARTLPAVLLLALAPLAGCTSGGASDESSGTSTSASAGASDGASGATDEPTSSTPAESPTGSTGSPSATPSGTDIDPDPVPKVLPRNRLEAAGLHVAVLGTSVADTAQERAVVDAWMTYWQGVADTYYLSRPSAGFQQVARGQARSDILSYLARTKRDNERVMGWARENITRITVAGSTARITDCTKNFTFRVDAEGEPVTRPTPFYDTRGTLQRSGGGWVVTSFTSKDRTTSCLR